MSCGIFRHGWKPVATHGPRYFFGAYIGRQWALEDQLACTKCGARREPFLTAIQRLTGMLAWVVAVLFGFSVAAMLMKAMWLYLLALSP